MLTARQLKVSEAGDGDGGWIVAKMKHFFLTPHQSLPDKRVCRRKTSNFSEKTYSI